MGRDPVAFLKNRLMWVGFGIAAAISLLNGLSNLYPTLPSVPVGWTRFNFNEKPWSYMVYTRISCPAFCYRSFVFYAARPRLFRVVFLLPQKVDTTPLRRRDGLAESVSR